MIATPKQKRVSTKKIAISEPIPIPAPPPVVAEKPSGTESKPLSYRQKLIEKIGIEAVREKERLSRQATKEKKAQTVISV